MSEVVETTGALSLVEQIKVELESFFVDDEKSFKGNKKASQRARKSSLSLNKLFKQYRKDSLERDAKVVKE